MLGVRDDGFEDDHGGAEFVLVSDVPSRVNGGQRNTFNVLRCTCDYRFQG